MAIDGPRFVTVRFASFQLHVPTRELRKRSQLIRLQPKQFDILLLLIEHAGQILSRDQIRASIWGEDTFVDFERSINFAINQIRAALGDSAEFPKFIETVPRFGYKFICPVELVENTPQPETTLPTADPPKRQAGSESEPSLPNDELDEPPPLRAADLILPDNPVPAQPGGIDPPPPKPSVRLIPVALSLLILLALTAAAWHYRHGLSLSRHSESPSSSSRPRVRTIPITYVSGNIHHPVFSPDGKQIAFIWDGPEHKQQNIYTMPIGGNQPYQVTRSGPAAMTVSWSPDGQLFAYFGCTDDQGGIFVVPALGGPERRLALAATSGCEAIGADLATPQWTHDGKYLLIEDPCGAPTHWTLAITLLSVSTGEKRCLTTPPPYYFDMKFQLSPDGTRVAFVRAPSGNIGDYYVVPITGGAPIRLTNGEIQFVQPMWSGDSRRIIFYSGHPAQYGNGLVSVPASGGAIMPEPEYAAIGSLSPDGRRVVCIDSNLPEDHSIWKVVFDAPGGRVLSHRKIIDSTMGEDSPQLSPDGTRIAFASGRSGNAEVWTSKTDGTDPVKLTSFGGELTGSPHWSPDGKQIVFDRRPGPEPQVWLMDADGSNLRLFNSGEVPSWSRDGRSIYFQSLGSDERQIWRQPLSADQRSAEGPPAQITRTGGFSAIESYDGRTVFYTRWGSDGIWSVPSAGGPETRVTDSPKSGRWGDWAVSEAGLYSLDCHTSPHCTFQFYNFKTRKPTSLFQIAIDPREGNNPGFTASRDGKTLIYTLFRPSNNFIAMTELLP